MTLTSLPISPVRYDTRTIDLTDVRDEARFQQSLVEALHDVGRSAIAEHGEGALKVVSARLRFSGRSPAHRMVPSWIEKAKNVSPYPVDSVDIEIDACTSAVRPAIELAQLAAGSDPAAETARLLLALDQPTPEPVYDALIDRTFAEMLAISRLPGYAGLAAQEQDRAIGGPTKETARDLVRAQAWTVLSALVAQKEDA